MSGGIVARAAHNNALWCDLVCATHQGSGEFHEDLWINRFGVPSYYPAVVTLKGADAALTQTRTIAALVDSAPHRAVAVKDSFQCLDLSELGFTPLFDAEWIAAPAVAPSHRAALQNLQWRRVNDERALLKWEQTWSKQPAGPRSRIFMPGLLSEPDIHFIVAADQSTVLGGGILNRGAGVVGISNVFADGIDPGVIFEGLAHFARSTFPGLPIVAYEQQNEKLKAAYHVDSGGKSSCVVARLTVRDSDRGRNPLAPSRLYCGATSARSGGHNGPGKPVQRADTKGRRRGPSQRRRGGQRGPSRDGSCNQGHGAN